MDGECEGCVERVWKHVRFGQQGNVYCEDCGRHTNISYREGIAHIRSEPLPVDHRDMHPIANQASNNELEEYWEALRKDKWDRVWGTITYGVQWTLIATAFWIIVSSILVVIGSHL